jgi:NADPH2:quinone reductase
MGIRSARAVVIDEYGGPDVLQWRVVEVPPPPRGEVTLRTIVSPVNRADLEIRSGKWPIQRDHPFPYVPGLELLGTVTDVGADVETPVVGQRAATMMQRLGGIHGERPGGYGEYVTVPASSVAVVPDDVDPLEVAALGLAAVTALEGLDRLELEPGERVVIHGASGGVGSVAVSLARRRGCEVVAAVSRPEHEEYVRSLGANEVVVLSRGTLVDFLGARTVDAVLETLGARTFPDSVAVLRQGGRLCLVGALTGADLRLAAWDLMQDLHLTGFSSENLTGDQLRCDMQELVSALRTGSLRPPELRTLPMSCAREAHRLLEAGAVRGRVLLVTEPPPGGPPLQS